ncbi:hypothetical protein QYM36_000069 [Artemia franciscana]|uniref:Derlin n=1 Tax=Artemia franciscana TaxID=6661 RepID=A0AA88IDW0_ARTSF|nr:hypothetical protein QYM36_000069 [Artemia franciscana]
MYFYEICHSLRVAERVAVPLRSVRRGSRVKGWASNSELVKARAAAKFWLGVWHECDRPKSGVVNELRVYTKRRFAKELRKHRSSLKRETVSKIIENPNLVWKLRARPVESTGQNASDIDEEIWVDYFAAEFSPPDEVKNKKFSEELDQLMTKEHNYLICAMFVNLLFLGHALTTMLVYVWSRRNPFVRMNFFGLLPFSAPYLPWVLVGFSLLLGNSVVVDLIGIAVGHVYFFLEDVFPNQPGGMRLLKTPRILKVLFDPPEEQTVELSPEDRPGGFEWGGDR